MITPLGMPVFLSRQNRSNEKSTSPAVSATTPKKKKVDGVLKKVA
jgi:hypothetical protein